MTNILNSGQDKAEEEYEDESDGEEDSDMSDSKEEEEEKLWEEWVEVSSDDEEMSDEEKMSGEEEMSDEESESGRAFNMYWDHQKIHREKIRFLREPDHKVRAAVLENAEKELICFLNEICWNLLRGDFSGNKYEKRLLQNFKEILRYLANEETSKNCAPHMLHKSAPMLHTCSTHAPQKCSNAPHMLHTCSTPAPHMLHCSTHAPHMLHKSAPMIHTSAPVI
ncbi:G-protein coupled receptor family C group 6 member A [Frankliniella fusca]|uniref:G-protein coupled receptor family C group 6 member A n=1 Tax=Frankliniella fusca TaxID=407009 RepID=A0AAE1LEN1_9NEOP|nr:G-protein coupled receptor family C group 6 member A [Frankliniella fusca]